MERKQYLIALVALALLVAASLAGLDPPPHAGSAIADVVRQNSAGTAAPDDGAAIGVVTTDAQGVRITVMPRIAGAPFTAFTAVFPPSSSDAIVITLTPSPGELALARGDPANLQIIDLLTSAPLTCSATDTQLLCLLARPGKFAVQVSEAVAGARGGPAPITALPQQGAGVISVGPTATPVATPEPEPPQ